MGVPKEHGTAVQSIFKNIANVYDGLNTFFSFGQDARWRRKLVEIAVKDISKGCSTPILDLAAGTLKVTKAIVAKKPKASVIAIDFCTPMLKKGLPFIKKSSTKNILALTGDSLALPLADNSVSAITVAFGLRNFVPREIALQEMFRVLIPGGKLCILEFGSAKDKILFGMYNWYLAHILPAIGKLVSKDKGAYQYLAETIVAFPSAKELVKEIEKEGFHNVEYFPLSAGIVCLHSGIKPRTLS